MYAGTTQKLAMVVLTVVLSVPTMGLGQQLPAVDVYSTSLQAYIQGGGSSQIEYKGRLGSYVEALRKETHKVIVDMKEDSFMRAMKTNEAPSAIEPKELDKLWQDFKSATTMMARFSDHLAFYSVESETYSYGTNFGVRGYMVEAHMYWDLLLALYNLRWSAQDMNRRPEALCVPAIKIDALENGLGNIGGFRPSPEGRRETCGL